MFVGVIGTEVSAGVGSLGSHSDAGLAVFIPVMAAATVSSIYGFVRTSQCRDAYASRVGTPIYAPPPPPFVPPPQ